VCGLLLSLKVDVYDLYREAAGHAEVSYTAKNGCDDSTIVSRQTANPSNQHHKLPSDKYCHAGARGHSNKSSDSDSVTKQCLRSRTRSLDRVKTSDVKDASAKSLRSNVKRSGVKVGRLRSQSEERKVTLKSSANKSGHQLKLTIAHTPQLLK